MTDAQAFLEAVKTGDADAVRASLAADPRLVNARDDAGNSAVLLAAYYGRKPVARILLAHRPELNLHEAAAVGDLDRVAAILSEDPDLAPDLIDAFSHDGFAPLGLAAYFGHADLVDFLLARGAAVNLASHNAMQVMPLHSAAAGRSVAIARALLEHGADVNAAQQDGFRPLHAAAQNGQTEMISLLIAYGADVDAQDDEGRTPLAWALAEGHAGAAETLRQNGAAQAGP